MGDLLDFRKTEQPTKNVRKTLLSLPRKTEKTEGQLQEIGRLLGLIRELSNQKAQF